MLPLKKIRKNSKGKLFSMVQLQKISHILILVVGSGTGVLSMFAAKLGAKKVTIFVRSTSNPTKVYAVEASTPIAEIAETIIAENGLSEIVTVINSTVEDVRI
jgi:protein arginine N-methyltransferase 1